AMRLVVNGGRRWHQAPSLGRTFDSRSSRDSQPRAGGMPPINGLNRAPPRSVIACAASSGVTISYMPGARRSSGLEISEYGDALLVAAQRPYSFISCIACLAMVAHAFSGV